MKTLLIIIGLVAVVVLGLFLRARAADASVWRELSLSVPAQALTASEAQITNDSVSARLTAKGDEVGHLQLANGDIWRFAFRSHHFFGGPDSFSVFSGPLGTFRVRGDYFCCEVQFPDGSVPKDSAEFLAFLQRVHNSVESVR